MILKVSNDTNPTYWTNSRFLLLCTNILLILNVNILGGPTGFREKNETTQNSLSFLSTTTVVFHRSHYTTISKVGMHKIKCEVKNMKNMLVFALLCYSNHETSKAISLWSGWLPEEGKIAKKKKNHIWWMECGVLKRSCATCFDLSKCSFSKEISFVTAVPNHHTFNGNLQFKKCHAHLCLIHQKVIIVEILLHCNSKLWKSFLIFPSCKYLCSR